MILNSCRYATAIEVSSFGSPSLLPPGLAADTWVTSAPRASIEHPEVPHAWERRVAERLVQRSRRAVSRVAAGSDGCDVHSLRAHVLGRACHQLPRDSSPLVVRIDGDDVDNTHSLVKCVECDGGKPHGQPIGNRNEHISVLARATRPHGLRLNRTPLRFME